MSNSYRFSPIVTTAVSGAMLAELEEEAGRDVGVEDTPL
jgi:hypothetical protein